MPIDFLQGYANCHANSDSNSNSDSNRFRNSNAYTFTEPGLCKSHG